MGLDLRLARLDEDPDFRARWAYSGFNAFRTRLAQAVGIELDKMRGFGGDVVWPSREQEPLESLLNHSDCDGWLEYGDCEAAVEKLETIVSLWPEDDYDRIMGLKLVAMMKEVVKGDAEMVVFQ